MATVTGIPLNRVTYMGPPANETVGGSPRPPTEEEKYILALLAQGLTDQVVAQRLGLPRRTYRRRLKKIMDELGAKSRFQAGVLAERAGWLTVRS